MNAESFTVLPFFFLFFCPPLSVCWIFLFRFQTKVYRFITHYLRTDYGNTCVNLPNVQSLMLWIEPSFVGKNRLCIKTVWKWGWQETNPNTVDVIRSSHFAMCMYLITATGEHGQTITIFYIHFPMKSCVFTQHACKYTYF